MDDSSGNHSCDAAVGLVAAAEFSPAGIHLDTASVGLGCNRSVQASAAHLDDWAAGRCDPAGFDTVVDTCRGHAASLLGTHVDRVAIISQLSVAAGLVAQSLPPGATVLTADIEFTSVLFPFLVRAERGELNMVSVPVNRIVDRAADGVDAVAVSAVQSADGAVIDLDALASVAGEAFTFIDTTQSTGWLTTNADNFDVVACGSYKWMCSPRGTGFMTASDRAIATIEPTMANWYAGDDRWQSTYRGPLRLSPLARRFDLSPAWPAWVGAEPALQLLADIGPAAIGDHNRALANRFRAGLGLEPQDSAIVSIEMDSAMGDPAQRLTSAGIKFAGRDGRMRFSFHLYNTIDDVDTALAALSG